MSEKNNTSSGLEIALEGYARLVTEQNKDTNIKISSLTMSVQELVRISIQAEERHKQYDERFARIEDNQKAAGLERKALTEHMILTSKDIERNADRWAGMYKVLSGILTTVIGAAIIAIWIANK
jgi:hypothetical protein